MIIHQYKGVISAYGGMDVRATEAPPHHLLPADHRT